MNRHVEGQQRSLWVLLLITVASLASCTKIDQRPNILFIAVDDLRPQLGAYGESFMKTPNLDRLSEQGILFNNHFVQVPTCGASRFSMLTGMRPRSTDHLSNEAIRTQIADASEPLTTWPQLLRENGYRTIALGKIGHYPDSRIYTYDGIGDGREEMPGSWDETWGPVDKWGTAWNAFFGYSDGKNRNALDRNVLPYEIAIANDEDLPDGVIAKKAVETLVGLKASSEPFLLAVGFFKPHLPFTAPKRYWDMYEEDSIPISPNPAMPVGVSTRSVHSSGELFNSYKQFPEKGGAGVQLTDSSARLLRHAYFASVSYVDAQIGKIIDRLDELGLKDNTKIVIWGDHGWHLGDQTIWGKHTNFEQAVRSTLIVYDPGQPARKEERVVESVDIFPAMLEWADVEGIDRDGSSLQKLAEDEKLETGPALSYFRGGVSYRSRNHRLVWYPGDSIEFELYDHNLDPYETINVATQNPQIVNNLLRELKSINHYEFE